MKDDIADDFEWPLKVSFRYSKRFQFVSRKYRVYYILYDVSYNGLTSYVSNYFYCCIRSEGLWYDAERDLLTIAKFFCDKFAVISQ